VVVLSEGGSRLGEMSEGGSRPGEMSSPTRVFARESWQHARSGEEA